MAKQIRYTIEVVFNAETLYLQRGVKGYNYVELEDASSTADFAELGYWKEYVQNDFNNGSIVSFDVVLLELKVKNANVDAEINAALANQGLAKLNKAEKDALGL